MKIFAIILIVVGILMIFINQVGFTQKEKVIDLGSVEVNRDEKKEVSWPLYAGISVGATEIVMLISSKKKLNKY